VTDTGIAKFPADTLGWYVVVIGFITVNSTVSVYTAGYRFL